MASSDTILKIASAFLKITLARVASTDDFEENLKEANRRINLLSQNKSKIEEIKNSYPLYVLLSAFERVSKSQDDDSPKKFFAEKAAEAVEFLLKNMPREFSNDTLGELIEKFKIDAVELGDEDVVEIDEGVPPDEGVLLDESVLLSDEDVVDEDGIVELGDEDLRLVGSNRALTSLYKFAKKKGGKYSHIDFKPPEGAAKAAKRGLELRRKNKGKGGLSAGQASKQGIGSGVQRASDLVSRDNLSPATVKRMKAFFDRHQKNKKRNPGTPLEKDKGYIAWLLWGGDAGYSWAKKVVRQMEAADKKKKKAGIIFGMIKNAYDYSDKEQVKAFEMRNALVCLKDFIDACKAAGRGKECMNASINECPWAVVSGLDYDSEDVVRINNRWNAMRNSNTPFFNLAEKIFGIEGRYMTVKELEKKLKAGASKLKKKSNVGGFLVSTAFQDPAGADGNMLTQWASDINDAKKKKSKKKKSKKKSKSVPTNKSLYAKVRAAAKRKFKKWPSAYASGWLVKEYKRRGGGYKTV